MNSQNIDLYIMNDQFKVVTVVDYYSSLNWDNDMFGEGECEIKIPITGEYDLSYIQRNYYIARKDEDTVFQITYTETAESNDGADVMLVKGVDITTVILNKRIIFQNFIFSGSVISMIRKVMNENFISPAIAARKCTATDGSSLFSVEVVGDAGSDLITYQTENQAVGELFKELVGTFKYGMKLTVVETNHVVHLVLKIYRPSNRSSYVIFDQRFDNIVSNNFTSEFVAGSNLILVGGENNGASRKYQSVGSMATGLDRNEAFLDAKDLSSNIDWRDLLTQYPPKKQILDFPYDTANGGYTLYLSYEEDGRLYERWAYRMTLFKIPIQDDNQFILLRQAYADYVWFIDVDPVSGITYFYIKDCDIAILDKDIYNDPPTRDEDGNYSYSANATAMDVLYSAMMIQKGYEAYQEGTLSTAFSAEIDPNATFKYKRDYILADYVGIYNKYGIKAAVQITNIKETVDPSGYHMDVTLSDAKSKEVQDIIVYCGTDATDTTYILTDDGDYLCL